MSHRLGYFPKRCKHLFSGYLQHLHFFYFKLGFGGCRLFNQRLHTILNMKDIPLPAGQLTQSGASCSQQNRAQHP